MPRNVRKRPLSGTADPAPRPYEAANASLARRAAAEGFVLLENQNNLLPLSPKAPLALFGAGATHTVKGGTGSGDVNERASVSIRQGLVEAGFSLTTDQWLDDCEARYAAARQAWKQEVLADARVREQAGELSAFFMAYSARPFLLPAGGDVYATEAEVAVYVLARVAGEGADRQAGPGDYALSAEEHAQLADLCRLYRHVVLLINAGGVVDLSCLDEFPAIEAVLVISQPGMEGGRAVADVLSGAVNPSGKLTDTWAFRYADYPNAATFSHNNGNVEQEIYQEGLYVGYRYFDSFEIAVRYGFGFGLSYTEFELDGAQVACAADGTVLVKVAVTNAGKRAGREVVQLYAGLPDGKLEKEARRLIAFAKTGLLAPGETEVLTLSFGPECLESYDEVAAAWILEPGIYGLYLGDSLAESGLVAALDLPAAKILTKTETICPPEAPVGTLCLPANRRAARYAAMCLAAKGVPVLPYDLSAVAPRIVSYNTDEAPDEASRLVDALSVDQLVCLATGEPSKGQGAEEAGETGGALGNAGAAVPGSAAETSSAALAEGVAPLVLADGPAGLRLTQTYYLQDGKPLPTPMSLGLEHGLFYDGPAPQGEARYQYCTAMPVGTLLAQSWDLALLRAVGDAIGAEMALFGVDLWLAPGMNLHRNPLCGRNFEYFAEDPLLSGRCAAAITQGVQRRPGLGVTIKHFACNNQEDNRMASNSILTERCLRELYLKGFEIAVREARPRAIMTSYNLINGVHAANCYDLCTKVARCEFGFTGLIMTDWTTTNIDAACTAAGCILAGNDVVMPGMAMDHASIRAALADGSLTEARLRWCITHLVRVILQSDRYE